MARRFRPRDHIGWHAPSPRRGASLHDLRRRRVTFTSCAASSSARPRIA